MVVVDAVVSQVAPLLHRMLGPAQALRVELAAPDQLLRLDPANLELALLNLVANARDAMPDGGTVLISTQVVDEAPGLDAPAPAPDALWRWLTSPDDGNHRHSERMGSDELSWARRSTASRSTQAGRSCRRRDRRRTA